MTIKDFLTHSVEGYLFKDLKNMGQIQPPPPEDKGAAGYPMLMSALAGMELLGYLLMPNDDLFDGTGQSDNAYFSNYWNHYFAAEEPKYKGLSETFRSLIRNGLAHTFLTKHGIVVTKGTNRKIIVNATQKELHVDASVFCQELVDSYTRYVRPIVDGTATGAATTPERMQMKLDSVEAEYAKKSKNLFDTLAKTKARFNDITPSMAQNTSYHPPEINTAMNVSASFSSQPMSRIIVSSVFTAQTEPVIFKKQKPKNSDERK